ncbi:MAG: saccharopine dehydrogenase NADP-binding domain-containing protein [Elusimicrobia bacterium]|nr:saccharopine dehydrogenase NADP-binding domain-containing protein [Elusimicrobiota bacterium]
MIERTIAVLGAGMIGKRIVDDLLRTFDGNIVVLSRHPGKSRRLFPGRRRSVPLVFRAGDATRPTGLVKALKGAAAVVNAVHHEHNEAVMGACLRAGAHYVDLGGLYHYTLKQLAWRRRFERARLTAVLGMGAAPGITNVLAACGASELTRVDAVEIRIGMVDRSSYRRASPLSNSYSLQTLLEECSWPPAVFRNGKAAFLEPFSGRDPYRFPAPVGRQTPQYTIHSEVATLPRTLRARDVFFKIAFDDGFVERIQALREAGLLDPENVSAAAGILSRLPPAIAAKIEQYEIIQVIVKGRRGSERRTARWEAHVPAAGETVDKDTAAPASIVAQGLARGEITRAGVFPPESVIEPGAFFEELGRRGIRIHKNGRRVLNLSDIP